MKLKNSQRGMTAIGMAMIVAMLVVFLIIGIKLAPVYIESFKVSSALNSLQSEAGLVNKSNTEITKMLTRRLSIDDVEHVTLPDISIERNGPKVTIAVDYEVRKPMFGNIDVVVAFSKQAEVGK